MVYFGLCEFYLKKWYNFLKNESIDFSMKGKLIKSASFTEHVSWAFFPVKN